MDLSGRRALANYYDDNINNTKFERNLFLKTRSPKARDDVFIIDNSLVVHRFISELHIYVVGNRLENPLVLDRILNCLVEVTSTLMNQHPENKTLSEDIKSFIMAFDEICDRGIPLETDPNLVLDRVFLKDGVAEQTLVQVLQSATEIRFPWLK